MADPARPQREDVEALFTCNRRHTPGWRGLLAEAWSALFAAQREYRLALSGAYAWVRHPQYVGFVIIMTGLLLQWPTIPTLVMYPVIDWVYVRLAKREKAISEVTFGAEWRAYALRTPAFVPRRSGAKKQAIG